nr:7386_t:CDS:10 [Entrophospora candida]
MNLILKFFSIFLIQNLAFAQNFDPSTKDGFYNIFYDNLQAISCTRSLNSNGVAGCQVFYDTTGILYLVEDQNGLTGFINNGPNGKFAVVMPYYLLNNENLRALESSNKLGGVIVVINNSTSGFAPRPNQFSPDVTCPNCEYGLYRNDSISERYNWNPNGLGINKESYDFPIFAIYSSNISGFSVYSTPSIDMNHNDGKPIVIVSSKMDSKSFFADLTLGVDNGISGTIALLAVADALSRSPITLSSFPKHILYTIFNGEEWGFAGSQRFVKDISSPFECQKNESKSTQSCPFVGGCTFPCQKDLNFTQINFDKIDSIFEFSQVGHHNTTGFYYTHVDGQSNLDATSKLINQLITLSKNLNNGSPFIQQAGSGDNRKLPPSSSMAFLEKNRNIPAIILADYQSNFSNYYNSEFDDVNNDFVSISNSICTISNATAQAVWLHAQGLLLDDTKLSSVPISVNCSMIDELLDCLTFNYSCPLTNRLFNSKKNVSFFRVFNYDEKFISAFTSRFMANITAIQKYGKCESVDDCQQDDYCINNECVKSFTRYHHSYGTGLEFNEKGQIIVVDPSKPTWVESVWDDPSLRLFIVSSTNLQIFELIFGITITIISIVGVLYGKKYLIKTLKID